MTIHSPKATDATEVPEADFVDGSSVQAEEVHLQSQIGNRDTSKVDDNSPAEQTQKRGLICSAFGRSIIY